MKNKIKTRIKIIGRNGNHGSEGDYVTVASDDANLKWRLTWLGSARGRVRCCDVAVLCGGHA